MRTYVAMSDVPASAPRLDTPASKRGLMKNDDFIFFKKQKRQWFWKMVIYAIFAISTVILIALLLFVSTGCSATNQEDAYAPTYEITRDDLLLASEAINSFIPEGSAITGVKVGSPESGKAVFIDCTTSSTDPTQLGAQAEEICRVFSQLCDQVVLSNLEAGETSTGEAIDGDVANEEEVAYWQDRLSKDEEEGALGTLYDDYGLVVSVENEDADLRVDGERAAGSDDGFNWQW